MDDLNKLLHENLSKDAIGELMLAKAALEAKNEIIDKKDRTIRGLYSDIKRLNTEVESIQEQLIISNRRLREKNNKKLKDGVNEVIKDIVNLILDYRYASSLIKNDEVDLKSELAEKILGLLKREYNLIEIDDPVDKINPEIHEVVEVVNTQNMDSSYIILSKGYKIGNKIIIPVRIKVLKGKEGVA